MNPQLARSQIMGGVVWGISQALHEETHTDHRLGRFMNHSFAEYHVAANADIHDVDVIFVEEDDRIVSRLGAKGVCEIGLVGVAAAVSNAIFHATGRRVRSTPITPEKAMGAVERMGCRRQRDRSGRPVQCRRPPPRPAPRALRPAPVPRSHASVRPIAQPAIRHA